MKKDFNILRDAHQEMQELKQLLDNRKTFDNLILSLSIATSLCILGAMISAKERFHARRMHTTQNTRGK